MTILEQVDHLKTKIDALRPFQDESMLDEIRRFYRVDLTYTSNALEGNSLTLSETKILLEDGLTTGGKPLRDTLEALGHAAAYDHMYSLLGQGAFTVDDILELHKLFYSPLDAKNAGVLREKAVIITGSQYPVTEPRKLDEAIAQLSFWMTEQRSKLHPVVYAARLHKNIVFIHPFIDGNGRVARLAMNTILIQNGYLPAVVPPILRHEYIANLEKAHQNDAFFVEFIATRVFETEKDFLRLMSIPWEKCKK